MGMEEKGQKRMTLHKSLFWDAWTFLESCEYHESADPVQHPERHLADATSATQYMVWRMSREELDIGETIRSQAAALCSANVTGVGQPYRPNSLHSDPFPARIVIVGPMLKSTKPHIEVRGFSALWHDSFIWGFTQFGPTTCNPAAFFDRFPGAAVFTLKTEA